MPNLNAALACAQLEKLDSFLAAKRKLAESYADYFAKTEYRFVTEPENSFSNYWLNAILLEDREERDLFLKYSNENRVMARPVWKLIPEVKMFKNNICEDISVAKRISECLVNIPSSPILEH